MMYGLKKMMIALTMFSCFIAWGCPSCGSLCLSLADRHGHCACERVVGEAESFQAKPATAEFKLANMSM